MLAAAATVLPGNLARLVGSRADAALLIKVVAKKKKKAVPAQAKKSSLGMANGGGTRLKARTLCPRFPPLENGNVPL